MGYTSKFATLGNTTKCSILGDTTKCSTMGSFHKIFIMFNNHQIFRKPALLDNTNKCSLRIYSWKSSWKSCE
ncbi:BnaC07g18550D [Brassica napus]|uniref:BnaC07g18550D protein n=1 Tax=Brassica napus TaxID=3708 RepID=A0A078HKD1_BRANA|nr:BnaC07g18550D [Brassica napus]